VTDILVGFGGEDEDGFSAMGGSDGLSDLSWL